MTPPLKMTGRSVCAKLFVLNHCQNLLCTR